MLECARCERNLKSGSKFCSACGAEVKPALKCVKCGTEYEKGDKFCCECGSVVGAESSLFGEFIDSRDGTRYRTVKFGSKIWMAENLNYGGKNGDLGKSCDNGYCRVYDWLAAKAACPEGWHLPSFREWYGQVIGGARKKTARIEATRGIYLKATDFFTTTRTNYAYWKSGA